MGTNTKTQQTDNHRAVWGQRENRQTIERREDYQRLNRLVEHQLGLERVNPYRYGQIVDGLECFWKNGVLWDVDMDATLLRKHMAFTLFVPAGRADRARLAVNQLDSAGYLGDIKARAWDDQAVEIMRPLVRFYKQKAKRLEACLAAFQEMRQTLPDVQGNMERRKWLQDNMPGYGAKAATHFMRNTGLMPYTDGLPIIDVHIHKALEHFNFLHRDYEESCDSFRSLADLVEVPVLILDAVLWCAYAKNWEVDKADFDNFGVTNPVKEGTVNNDRDTRDQKAAENNSGPVWKSSASKA